LLDAIQALGVHPIDVHAAGVDFLAADGHKWLLGPEGAGLLYVKQDRLETLRPPIVGWNSMAQPFEFDRVEWRLRPDAARFEAGSYNMAGFLGLSASLQLLSDLGLRSSSSDIEPCVLDFRRSAVDMLQRHGATLVSPAPPPEHQSGIFCFQMPGIRPEHVRKALLQQGVVVNCRGGGVRLSAHAYADDEDLRRLERGLRGVR